MNDGVRLGDILDYEDREVVTKKTTFKQSIWLVHISISRRI